MIIKEGFKKVESIFVGTTAIEEVRKGQKLIWQSARSCFGTGAWDNDLPWDNNDGWNNG